MARLPYAMGVCVALAVWCSTAGAAQGLAATDGALRSGMAQIRAAVIDHHTLITHRRLPVAMARTFANLVVQSVGTIRRETRVDSAAQALLEPILKTVEGSGQAIGAGGDSLKQMDALFAMTKALEAYGETFDDPDWKPIQER